MASTKGDSSVLNSDRKQNFNWHALPVCAVVGALLTLPEPTPVFWFSFISSAPLIYLSIWYGSLVHWRIIALQSVVILVVAPDSVVKTIACGLVFVQVFAATRSEISQQTKRNFLSLNIIVLCQIGEAVPRIVGYLPVTSVIVTTLIGMFTSRPPRCVPTSALRFAGRLLLIIILGLCISFGVAFGSLREGKRSAEEALAALRVGDVNRALELIETSRQNLTDAGRWLDSPLGYPARFVPVLGFNRDATVGAVQGTAETLAIIESELTSLNFDSLKVVNGRLNLDAVASLREPLELSTNALRNLRDELKNLRNPWNLPVVDGLLSDFGGKLDAMITQGENSVTAIDLAPRLFGSDRPRTYFVALTTPSESRGHGGFMGSWVELTFDDGKVSLTDQGRATDLNESGSVFRFVTGPDDWVRAYGDFGFTTGPGGGISKTAWQNITLSPYFDSTGEVITELFPQSGGRALDGVFAMDVKTLAALLEFSGPITVEEVPEPLTFSNAEEFLLFKQYVELPTAARIDVLEQVTSLAFDQILNGELPPPNILAGRLGPMVAEGRLTGYSSDPEIQSFFRRINMSGELPCEDVDDCLMVVADNASGSKIDYFLDIDSKVDFEFDSSRGLIVATMSIRLVNSAPDSGLPDYIIGNMVGLPRGFNRLLLSVHTTLYLDPESSPDANGWGARSEKSLNLYSSYVELASGEERTIELVFKGRLPPGETYSVATRIPPAVQNWSIEFSNETSGESAMIDSPGRDVFSFGRG